VTIELERTLPGIDPALLHGIVERLVELEPDARAVVVTGSHAKGTAKPDSDLDVRALTAGRPRVPYRTWFEERPDGVPLHVSAGAKSVDDWLAARRRPNAWSLGFPVRHDAVYLWATDGARAALGDPPGHRHPAAPPELEDFVEALAKVRRARDDGDGLGARWHAQTAATLAPRLLLRLNPERLVHDRRDALAAALGLRVAPDGYAADLAASLGLTEASDAEVAEAALRLGRRLLAFLREGDPDVDSQPGVADALRDGSFERLLDGGP
jgi:Nucleotidyltransferase domain